MTPAHEAAIAYVRHVNAGELDELVALFAPHATLLHPLGSFTGSAAIGEFYAASVLAHGPALVASEWVHDGPHCVFELAATVGDRHVARDRPLDRRGQRADLADGDRVPLIGDEFVTAVASEPGNATHEESTMTTDYSAPAGAPCWIDLMTSDPERSTAFYQALFGWTSESAGEEFGGYINFSTRRGLRRRRDAQRPAVGRSRRVVRLSASPTTSRPR